MSTFDVLQRFGTLALIRHAVTVLLFLVLHLIRIPLVLVARVIEGVMRELDRYATAQASRPRSEPVNQFFPYESRREARYAQPR
ncbi:hypothetical protein [Amycolatopsis panacis]|uniref:Uncharacterized protein n=1 Tax=Amycolatopsis panacis TaxID=2340917 RepID=A0A419I3L3_9PSEU|nr:hypothetical protein [Amycolatopsis panacis]RJQ84758.1 hypothetical protein D5S19_15955 [Amycolatopsis panacis]